MATLKARETLHLPAGAKARALPTTGKLVAMAKLKRNKPRINKDKGKSLDELSMRAAESRSKVDRDYWIYSPKG